MKDKKKDKKKEKKKFNGKWLTSAIIIIITGYCGGISDSYISQSFNLGDSFGDFLIGLWLVLFAVYIPSIMQIIVHEGGHLVFGLLSGYQFVSFRIGKYTWIKKQGKVQFKRYSLMGTGGQCLMLPPEKVNGEFPYVLYNLGGCIANLIVSAIALIIYYFIAEKNYMTFIILVTALIGVGYALVNGIPMQVGAVNNDGYNALNLSKDPIGRDALWMQFKIHSLQADGMRLRELPREWLYVPSNEEMTTHLSASLAINAFSYAIDTLDFAKARELGDNILQNLTSVTGIQRRAVECDVLYCELVGENRTEEIQKLMTKEFNSFLKAFQNNPAGLRLAYTLALLQDGDEVLARKKREAFDKVARTYPYEGNLASERELMDYTDEIYTFRMNKEEISE